MISPILMENRSPILTMAWLLVFWFLPIFGVFIYLFFGRGFTMFSKQDKMIRQEVSTKLGQEMKNWLERQDEEIEQLKKNGPPVYSCILELMRRNSQSPLFVYNTVQILQRRQPGRGPGWGGQGRGGGNGHVGP